MVKKDKILIKARNNPKGLSFDDLELLLKHHKWEKDHQTGSHKIWYSPSGYRISLQPKGKMAKDYQVKQFLSQLDKETEDE